METLNLQEIKKVIEKEQLDCRIIEAKDPTEGRLSVYMGEDYKNRGYWLNVRLIPQVLREDNSPVMEQGTIAPSYFALTYTLEFPFEVQLQATASAARLIAFLNSSVHFPGFQFSEIDQKVSFRHIALVSGKTLKRTSLMAVLGTIFLFKETYCEVLEQVCSGSRSMNDVLEELAAILKSL